MFSHCSTFKLVSLLIFLTHSLKREKLCNVCLMYEMSALSLCCIFYKHVLPAFRHCITVTTQHTHLTQTSSSAQGYCSNVIHRTDGFLGSWCHICGTEQTWEDWLNRVLVLWLLVAGELVTKWDRLHLRVWERKCANWHGFTRKNGLFNTTAILNINGTFSS